MADFDGYSDYDRKLELSEGTDHVRENEMRDRKKPEGYEANPKDPEYYEVMGIKNSFDNVSVSSDKYGQMLISVNSQKEPYAPTLDSDRKVMKSVRRKKKFGGYGDFYTNPKSDREGAFGFRADRNISDIRIYREFNRMAEKRVSKEQRGTLPFLRLEDDMAELSEMRGKGASGNDGYEERQVLEKRVRKETESRDRFVVRLRKARRKTYDIRDEEKEFLPLRDRFIDTDDDGDDENDERRDPLPGFFGRTDRETEFEDELTEPEFFDETTDPGKPPEQSADDDKNTSRKPRKKQ